MQYWPFMLVVGTRNSMTGKEEYRWTFLLGPAPARGAVFCRDEDGAMRKTFIQEHFGRQPVFGDYDELSFSLHRHWWLKRTCYWVQIEHFPDNTFPE